MKEEECYLISSKVSNLILLNIAEKIDNNADLICFLLTCKRLYFNIGQQHGGKIRFKHLEYIDTKVSTLSTFPMNLQFVRSMKHFNLRSFTSLFNNSLANQIVLSDDQESIPILNNSLMTNTTPSDDSDDDRLYVLIHQDSTQLNDMVLPINTKTVHIIKHMKTPLLPMTLFKGVKNLEQLFISQYAPRQKMCKLPESIRSLHILRMEQSSLDGGDMFPSQLETLELMGPNDPVQLGSLGLAKLQYLKTLKIDSIMTGPSSPVPLFPTSLVSLNIEMSHTPPADLFRSLVSLESLTLSVHSEHVDMDYALDLTTLHALESFELYVNTASIESSAIQLPFASSLRHLRISAHLRNLTTQFFPQSSLTSLDIDTSSLNFDTVALPTSLVTLRLQPPSQIAVPPGYIPNSVKNLFIVLYGGAGLLDGAIPSSVEELTMFGYEGAVTPNNFPNSIKKLTWNRVNSVNTVETTLPNQLEKFKWMTHIDVDPGFTHPSYPSTLLELEFSGFPSIHPPISYPSSLTKLNCSIAPIQDNGQPNDTAAATPIYSISSLRQLQDGPFKFSTILLRKLVLKLEQRGSFRLDQVINQTNVEKLSLCGFSNEDAWFKATIKRLDKDNASVLIVDNKSLFGGIIHQSRQPNNDSSTKDIYRPIYIHAKDNGTICWSFNPI
ncbi:hypothetical protein DFA_00886 [Cavenderia fasciculata]|uniref:Uncharacterized protein n=1 Tax=Cavenderia fasciculata TaxID=261658 RepID=F4PUE5_CACFS|nr:uncharacterized protein DFA_00886 [Cavenderia fasciculata]EGG21017.1 hypothetical protein DFA_00886 [Cavenderia fasciculata]|eukprot:XP_004358867.1 hypothetical protein DFA_00886 [Cavenderia fasciculata]